MTSIRNSVTAIFFTAFIIILTSHAQAQVVPGSEAMLAKLRLNEGLKGIRSVLYSEIKGDPYIFRNFTTATITTIDKDTIRIPIRYDIYADEMHLKNLDQIFAIIKPQKLNVISTDSIDFIYSGLSNSPNDNSIDYSYFIIRLDGRCRLLIKKNIRIQDAEPPKPYQNAKPAEFIHLKDSYYLKAGEKNAVPVSKKAIQWFTSDRKEAVEMFINTNKLNLKRPQDIERVIEYFNSL